MKRLMGTALLLCLLASSAHAQTASESFDYHAGADLNALNGGTDDHLMGSLLNMLLSGETMQVGMGATTL